MIKVLDIYDKLGWKQAKGYPRGTREKTLRDEGNAKTVLLKLPKGFHMESHSHITTEQHLVIRGKYESWRAAASSRMCNVSSFGQDP